MTLSVKRIVVLFSVLLLAAGIGHADTYHLSDEKGWQNTADIPESEYLLAVSKIKQQLLTGTKSDVVEALEKLKNDFPEMTGAEIDAYQKAEKLYAADDWYKAATAYRTFIDAWPVSVLQPAAMERLYSIGTAYLQGQKRVFLGVLKVSAFDTGFELMHDIAERSGNAPIALRALTTLAENQEKKKEFMDAYYTWQQIAGGWPTGATRKTALLRMAQALHASYEGTQYDATVIQSAKSYFEDYNAEYGDAAELKVPETIAMITEQLAYKEYETGLYYERTEYPEAARQSYEKVLKQWPNSKAAQMAKARMAPDAVPPVKMTSRRRTVNGITWFLDSWFGLETLFGSKDKNNTEE